MSEKMIFCLGDGKYESKGEGYQKNHRVFNKDVSEKEYKEIKKKLDEAKIKVKLTEWVSEKGSEHLEVIPYEDAWKNWLKESTKEQRETILNIKQFDEKIFKGITGLTKKDLENGTDSKRKKKLIEKAEELKDKAEELLEEANKM